jgi:1-phosphofructokinase
MINKTLTTVTLNPSIDKTITLESLIKDGLNRVQNIRYDAGGKGINLSVAFKGLGGDTKAVGINYRQNGGMLEDFLKKCNISYDFVLADGRLRENLKIYSSKTENITEINEQGGFVTEKNIKDLIIKVKHEAANSKAIALCGSIPKGVSSDIYKKLLEECNSISVFRILDAEEDMLLSGITSGPDMIKPNLFELCTVTGQKPKSHEKIVKTARDFAMPYGVSYVCVSMGEDGAMLVTKDESFYTKSLKVDVKGTTGAGDSFIAGFVKGLFEEKRTEKLLAYGVAAACDSVEKEGTMLCEEKGFIEKLNKIKVSKID